MTARALAFISAIALTSCASTPAAPDADAAIRQQIANYTKALDAADINLAAQVWKTTQDVTFIHPGGHAHGWEEVKGVYQFFGSAFSERKRLTVRDISIHVNGDTGWAEFYWHFDAKQSDGKPMQTDGRETQIYTRSADGWRLVHVHYSGPAITP